MYQVVSAVPLDVLLAEGFECLLAEPRRIHDNWVAVLVSELQGAIGLHRPANPAKQDLDLSGEGNLAGFVWTEIVFYGHWVAPALLLT